MNFIQEAFGKEIIGLSFADVQDYFKQRRTESVTLEFKSGEARINDVAKEACGLLNTKGGLLIVGSPREQYPMKKQGRVLPYCQGEPTPSFFKDAAWVQERIEQLIRPKTDSISVTELKFPDDGKLFLIEIEAAPNRPYQFEDGRFYYRNGSSCRPMPHAMVKEAFVSKNNALFKSSVTLDQNKNLPANQLTIEIFVRNFSLIPSESVKMEFRFFHIDSIHSIGAHEVMSDGMKGFEIFIEDPKGVFDEIELKKKFLFTHFFQPFCFSFRLWSANSRMHKHRFVYDPVNRKFLKHFRSGDQKDCSENEMLLYLGGLLKLL